MLEWNFLGVFGVISVNILKVAVWGYPMMQFKMKTLFRCFRKLDQLWHWHTCSLYCYSQRRRRTFPMMSLEPRLAAFTCRNRICLSCKQERWRAWGRGRERWLMKATMGRSLKWPRWRAEAGQTASWTSGHLWPSAGIWCVGEQPMDTLVSVCPDRSVKCPPETVLMASHCHVSLSLSVWIQSCSKYNCIFFLKVK